MDENQVRPCSHGTEGFLNAFTQNSNTLLGGGVFINIHTLLRNLLSDKYSEQEVLDKLPKEIQYIVSILAPTLAKDRSLTKAIVFYLFDYWNILKGYQLRPSGEGQRASLVRLSKELLRDDARYFSGADTYGKIAEVEGISVYGYHESRELPNNKLRSWMGSYSTITLISCMPIDWHANLFIPSFKVVSSYTGEVLKKSDFSTKVFSDSYATLPFYPPIHQLMGDKILLAPMLTPKEKKELVELAEKENWRHHSLDYVRGRVYDKYRIK